jgi:hypothetical protein
MQTFDTASSSTELSIPSSIHQPTGRRGGWLVYGGLKGGHPPKKEPVFANSDSNESDDDIKSKCSFAESTDLSSEDTESVGESDSESSVGNESLKESEKCPKISFCNPLPTIYAQKKNNIMKTQFSVRCDCVNNCPEAVANLTSEAVEGIKAQFVGESLTETKNIILAHLKTQSDMLETDNDGFFYKGHAYCGEAFSKLTGISRYILRKIQEAHMQGMKKFVHNNSLITKSSPRKVNAICWFKVYCTIYGQRAPDDIMVVLPSWLDVTTVFEMYKQENPIEKEQIKYSTFCNMLNKDFGPRRRDRSLPRVRFSKYSSHSVCSDCFDLNAFQRTCRTQNDIDLCRALKFKHRERFSKQQRCITSMRHLSQTFPDQHFSIFMDSMDNQKSHIPRFIEKTKKLANFYKLPSKVTGCILYSSHYPLNRKIKMFINFDQYEQGKAFIIVSSV